MGDPLVEAVAEALAEKCRLKAGGECVRYSRVAVDAVFTYLARPEVEERMVRAVSHADDNVEACRKMAMTWPETLRAALAAAREEGMRTDG
jgi:hypothetical protein